MKLNDKVFINYCGIVEEGEIIDLFNDNAFEVKTATRIILTRDKNILMSGDDYSAYLNPPPYIPSTRVFLSIEQLDTLIGLVENSGKHEELHKELVEGRIYFEGEL